jgi:hypothetical protein
MWKTARPTLQNGMEILLAHYEKIGGSLTLNLHLADINYLAESFNTLTPF